MIAAADEQVRKDPDDMPITGRFDQYRSSYWAAALAAVSIRYFPRPALRPYWKDPSATAFQKHAYSGIAGLVMEGVTGFYAQRTWHDMKSIFEQSLAWEFDKKPEDVTYADFKNSKNTIVKQTLDNYYKYNKRRALVNSVYFLPFVLMPFAKTKWFKSIDAEAGVDFGVATNAAYLLSDVIGRKITPFEELQSLIDRKINQSDHFVDAITTGDLLDIYERHAADGSVRSFLPQKGTAEWQESMKLFDRMADLINQTHKNVMPHEEVDFSFPKFVFLVGNGMIDPKNLERSAMFIEIANEHGIGAVKKAAAEIKNGATLDTVKEEFGLFAIAPSMTKIVDAELQETPSPMTLSTSEILPSANQNFKALANKDNMELSFQDKLRTATPAHEGLSA